MLEFIVPRLIKSVIEDMETGHITYPEEA